MAQVTLVPVDDNQASMAGKQVTLVPVDDASSAPQGGWKAAIAKVARPALEYGGMALGGLGGGIAGLPEGGVGAIPGGAIGGALGYAGGKRTADALFGPETPEKGIGAAAIGTAKDIEEGFFQESIGRGTGELLGLAGKAVDTAMHPGRAFDGFIKGSAAKAFDAATTKEGAVATQSAKNAAETKALSKRVPGFAVGEGQSTGDSAKLALQRRLGMQTDTAKVLKSEQDMRNAEAIKTHLDNILPEGDVNNLVGSLEKEQKKLGGVKEKTNQAAEKFITNISGDARESGESLRSGAARAKTALMNKANALYSKVPTDMSMDSTPLYNTLKEMQGEFDPEFQRIAGNPTGTVDRAEGGLTPKPSKILGPNGKPIQRETPDTITFGQLQKFRSQVTAGERTARASGNMELAYKYGKLREGVDETLNLATLSGEGKGVDALKDANKFYRETYIPSARQGATGRVLSKGATGAYKVEDAMVGKEYFKPGLKGVKAAQDFSQTFGKSADAKQSIREYAGQDLLAKAKNPATGEIEPGRVRAWLAAHKEALNGHGITKDFNTVEKASAIADEARSAETQFNKSRFAKAIDTDPDKAMSVLFSGNNAKNTGRTMQKLVGMTQGDKVAQAGLKRSFADFMMNSIRNSEQNMAGERVLSLAKVQNFTEKFGPAMKSLYSKDELSALKDVQKAVEIESRINKAPSGVAGSQTADMLSNAGQELVKKAIYHRIPFLSVVANGLSKGYQAGVNEYLARAMYDPEVATELRQISKAGKSKGPDVARKMLLNNMGRLGTIAAKTALQPDNEE